MGDIIKLEEDGSAHALIPKRLYLALARLQVAEELGWGEACDRLAELADSGSSEFAKKVKDEARKLHNSELMAQMNKARETIRIKGYNAGYQVGRKAGLIWYFCDSCGQVIWVKPNSDSHKAIIGYMKDHGWRHGSCQEA